MPDDAPPRLWNPANALTLSRVPLAFVFLALYPQAPLGALVALSLIELTDLTDGMVARKLGCVTDFGKLVDPFCDSFSRLTVFFALAAGAAPLVPLWMPVLCLLRDLAVAFVRTVAAAKGVVIAARTSGKVKALVQGPVAVAIVALAWLSPEHARTLSPWLMGVATAVTAWSLADYVLGSAAVLRAGEPPLGPTP